MVIQLLPVPGLTMPAQPWPFFGKRARTQRNVLKLSRPHFKKITPPRNELSGETRDLALKDFLSGVAWYRTAALDELSGEEADIVATRWVGKITAIIPLPQRVREALRCKISEEMRSRFVGK